MSWSDYLHTTKNKKARPLMIEALSYVTDTKNALDLGAGALNDTRFLLEHGFTHVDAVDSNPEVSRFSADFPQQIVSIFINRFDEFPFRDAQYDLVNAQFSLPFAGPEHIYPLLENIYSTLRVGGVFSGNFFGIEDGWSANPKLAFLTKDMLEQTFNSDLWEVRVFNEKREKRPTAAGEMKDWHLFDIIAIKKSIA